MAEQRTTIDFLGDTQLSINNKEYWKNPNKIVIHTGNKNIPCKMLELKEDKIYIVIAESVMKENTEPKTIEEIIEDNL